MEIKSNSFFTNLKQIPVSSFKVAKLLTKICFKPYKSSLDELIFLNTKSSDYIWNLIQSGIFYAKNSLDFLYITECFVTNGKMIKKFQPRAKGRAYKIQKKYSNVTLKFNYGSKS